MPLKNQTSLRIGVLSLTIILGMTSVYAWGVNVDTRVNTKDQKSGRDSYRDSLNRTGSHNYSGPVDNTQRRFSDNFGANSSKDSNNRSNSSNVGGDMKNSVGGSQQNQYGHSFSPDASNSANNATGPSKGGSAFGGRAYSTTGEKAKTGKYGSIRSTATGGSATSGPSTSGSTYGTSQTQNGGLIDLSGDKSINVQFMMGDVNPNR